MNTHQCKRFAEYFLWILFLPSVFTSWQLYDEDLINNVIVSDLTDWNLTPLLYQCPLTTGAQEYSTQQSFGQIDSNKYPYKRYDNLPPHAAVIVDLSIIFQNTAAPPLPASSTDSIQVIVDGSIIYNKGYKNLSGWVTNPICTSIYESIDYVASSYLIHNNPSLQVSIRNNFNLNALTQSKFNVRDFKIFLNLCDSSCTSCQNMTTDICDSCAYFTGAYIDSTTKKCVCPPGYYMNNRLCGSSCPSGTVTNLKGQCDKICDPVDCLSCSNQTTCTLCQLPKLLQDGICVTQCSPGYMQKVAGQCQLLASIYSNGITLAAAFNNLYYNQDYINSLGFTITKTGSSVYTNDIQFSYCGKDKILGGFLTLSSFKIQKSFSSLPPHSNVRIYFKAYIIDQWNNEQLKIEIDGTQTILTFNNVSGATGSQICGLSQINDQIYEFDKEIAHTTSTISLSVESVLDSTPDVKSFGIKDLYIILSACTQFCQICDATKCIQCMTGKIFYNQKCYDKCPDGLYYNGTTCVACNPACLTCDPTITIGNKCLTCYSSRVNNPPYCGCYKGFYDDGVNKDCQACRPFCLDCISQNQCNQCQGNRVTPLCSCPDNTYDNNQSICQQCNYFCDGCTGPNVSDCLACKGNRIYPGCICPPNTLDNGSSLICPKCNPGCISCTLIASNCSGCSSTTREGTDCRCKQGMMETYQKDCIQCDVKCKSCQNTTDNCNADCAGNRLPPDCSCPQYYYDNNTAFCVPCPYKCADCNIKGECTQCASIRINKPNCDCPVGYFDLGIPDCQLCSSKCSECQLNKDNCTVCAPNRSNPPTCNCSPGYYEDPISLTCIKCFTNCKTCTGKLQGECLECLENRVNKPYCVCPSKTYDAGTALCPYCYKGCTKCFGSQINQCISCAANRYLDGNNNCVCKDGFFDDNISEECLPCHFKCKTCSSYSICNECAANRINKPGCICPQYSFDVGQAVCQECPFKCLSCNQVTMECITCRGDRDQSSGCLCTGNTFDDGYNQYCQQCFTNCNGCFGAGPKNCQSCKDTYQKSDSGACLCDKNAYEDNGKCVCKTTYEMKNSICVKKTDDGVDPEDDGTGSKNCTVKYCKKCYKNTCLKCLENRVLKENICVCDNGYYQVVQNSKTFCQKCSLQNCSFCNIRDECERCDEGYALSTDLQNKQTCLEVMVQEEVTFPHLYILYIFILLFLAGTIPFICKQIYIIAFAKKKIQIQEMKKNPDLLHPSKFRKEREKYEKMLSKRYSLNSKKDEKNIVDQLLNSSRDNKKDESIIDKQKSDLEADDSPTFQIKQDDKFIDNQDIQNNLNESNLKEQNSLLQRKDTLLQNYNKQFSDKSQIQPEIIRINSHKQIGNNNKVEQSKLYESNLLISHHIKSSNLNLETNKSTIQKISNQKGLAKLRKQLVS